MGEITDMILDGTLCSVCGEFLVGFGEDGESQGFPGMCASCATDASDVETL